MKTRVITGLIGAAVFIGGLVGMFTPVFPCMVAIITGVAAFELTRAVDVKNKLLKIASIVTAAAVPFFIYFKELLPSIPLYPVITILTVAYLIVMVISFEKTSFEDVLTCFCSSFVIPAAYSSMIMISKLYVYYPDRYSKVSSIFYIIFAFFCAWISDIFAYFVGRKLGKHKLAPHVSPKKSVEGAIGGIFGALILNIVLLAVFNKFFFEKAEVGYIEVAIVSVILSVISIFGDLSMSVIKRKHGIKDYGNLLPGHGGVLDRFDSCLFVLPVLYSVIVLINM